MANKIVFIVGLVLLGLYIVCVIYPYHIGGYGDLPKVGEGLQLRTKSLGITRFMIIAIFSYFLSYAFIGIFVLVFSILCIFLGSRKMPKSVHFGCTAIAVLVTLFAAVNMNNYEIINFVLE